MDLARARQRLRSLWAVPVSSWRPPLEVIKMHVAYVRWGFTSSMEAMEPDGPEQWIGALRYPRRTSRTPALIEPKAVMFLEVYAGARTWPTSLVGRST